jgi:uncharacterized protein YndB with AHSA1/START domain
VSDTLQRDPRLDLLLERVVDVPPDLVWAAWTVPAHVKKWFTPAPWKTVECEIDLRPGGIFRTVMRSPEGQDITNLGCFLEIVANRKLVWTVALGPGYRPSNPTFDVPLFTAVITSSRMETEPNIAPSPSTRTSRAATRTIGWDLARDGARRSISSSPMPRQYQAPTGDD